MHDFGVAEAQLCRQNALSRGGIEQIRAAHDVSDALFMVINDHDELVGPIAIRATDNEVTGGRLDVLALWAVPSINEVFYARGHSYTPCTRSPAGRQACATGAGVGSVRWQFLARAPAGISQPLRV